MSKSHENLLLLKKQANQVDVDTSIGKHLGGCAAGMSPAFLMGAPKKWVRKGMWGLTDS